MHNNIRVMTRNAKLVSDEAKGDKNKNIEDSLCCVVLTVIKPQTITDSK